MDIGFHDAWDDPSVQRALNQRSPARIALLCCQSCGNHSYYNEGSHFECSWCNWSIAGEELDELLEAGECISLDDYTDMMIDHEDFP